MEYLAMLKDAVVAVAAAVTATVAVLGLTSWRRELKGKVDFEIAREMMKSTYRLRDEIFDFRAPMLTSSEFPDDFTLGGTYTSDEEARAYAHVYGKRWTPVREAVSKFDLTTLEAEVLWGQSIRQKSESLRQCVNDLRIARDAFVRDKASGGRDFRADPNFGVRMSGCLSRSADGLDQLSSKIAAAVSAIETSMRPHLRSRGPIVRPADVGESED